MSVVHKQINVDSICEDHDLKQNSSITPDDVLKLTKITDGFLCPNSNEYQIEFTRFKIRDLETDTVGGKDGAWISGNNHRPVP